MQPAVFQRAARGRLVRALRSAPRVLGLSLLACSCSNEAVSPDAQNLLLISVDTLRADALGSYGNPRGATPELDGWAARGVRFARAWSHSPKTAPSHMSMLTGLPPRVHGVGNLNTAGVRRLGPDTLTLAEILSARGIRSAGFSSGGNVKASLGFERGFELYEDQGQPLARKLASAEAWVEGLRAGERWFLFLHTYHVHDPYFPEPEDLARFADPEYSGEIVADRELLKAAIAAGDDRAPQMEGHDDLLANYWRRVDEEDERDIEHLENLYLAGVAGMDRLVGGFLERLEERGALNETLVVLTSDHGEEFREHGALRHDQLWRELLHVPLFLRLPGERAAGGVVGADVRHVDLVPSLLELLAVPHPAPAGIGESWAGWLFDPELARSRPVHAEHRSRRDADLDLWTLRSEGWLLHQDRAGRGLFDTRADPREQTPLDSPAERLQLEDMRLRELGRLQALAERHGSGDGVELDAETRAELEALGYL